VRYWTVGQWLVITTLVIAILGLTVEPEILLPHTRPDLFCVCRIKIVWMALFVLWLLGKCKSVPKPSSPMMTAPDASLPTWSQSLEFERQARAQMSSNPNLRPMPRECFQDARMDRVRGRVGEQIAGLKLNKEDRYVATVHITNDRDVRLPGSRGK